MKLWISDLISVLKTAPKKYCYISFVGIAYAFCTVAYTAVLQGFVDYILVRLEVDKFPIILTAFIIVSTLTALTAIIKEVGLETINQKLLYNKQMGFLDSFLRADYKTCVKWNTGEMLDRYHKVQVFADISNVFVEEFIVEVFSFIFVVVYIVQLNSTLALLVILGTIFTSAAQYSISKKTAQFSSAKVAYEQELARNTSEYFSNLIWIKNLGIRQYVMNKVEQILKLLIIEKSKYVKSSEIINQASYLLFELLKILVYVIAGYQVLNNNITPGGFLAFYSYIGWLDYSFSRFWRLIIKMSGFHASLAVIQEINNLSPADDDMVNITVSNQLTVSDLEFSYSEESTFALSNINMVFEIGRPTIIMGSSGCGKTTLLSLIAGFYRQTNGEVLIDNVRISNFSAEQRGQFMGFVPQHIDLFSGTIRENLCLGKNYSDDALWQALHIVDLDIFIKSLPEGLNAVIGKGNMELSAGQTQRIAFAQAILVNRPILILDEPTANLDTSTSRIVMSRLNKWGEKRILIYVMHHVEKENLGFYKIYRMGEYE